MLNDSCSLSRPGHLAQHDIYDHRDYDMHNYKAIDREKTTKDDDIQHKTYIAGQPRAPQTI